MKTKIMTVRLRWGFALAVCLVAMTAFAQAGFGPGGDFTSEQALERLQHDLDLTEEQTVTIRSLMDDASQQEVEILDRYGLTREQFAQLQKDLYQARDDFFTRMQTVLSDEQKEELNQHGPMGGHRPPPPPAGEFE
ncbi:MAG: hypothetical protein KKA54_09915 [Proteobacteria bacterium]|nr:hypothetical protein [Pseudomonadota bacterium]